MEETSAPDGQPTPDPPAPAGIWRSRLRGVAQAVANYALGPPAPAREDEPRARPEGPSRAPRPANGSLPSPAAGGQPTAAAGLPLPPRTGLRQTTGPVSVWSRMAKGADSEPSYAPVRSEGWLGRGEWLMDSFSDVTASLPGRERPTRGSVAVTNHRIMFTGEGRELVEWPLEAAANDGEDPLPTRVRVSGGTALGFSEEHEARDFSAAARAAILLRQHLS